MHRKGPQKINNGKASLACQRRNGQQHIGNLQLFEQPGQVCRCIHRHGVEPAPLQVRVVVNKAQHALLVRMAQGRCQLAPCRARTIDHDPGCLALAEDAAIKVAQKKPHQHPACAHAHKQQQRLDHPHRAGNAVDADHGKNSDVRQAVSQHGPCKRQHGLPTGKPENAGIQPIRQKNGRRQHHRHQHCHPMRRLQNNPVLQAQAQRQPHRDHAQQSVGNQSHQPLDRAGHVHQKAHHRVTSQHH